MKFFLHALIPSGQKLVNTNLGGDEDECRPTPGKRQFARVACGAWATLVACHFCDRDVLHQGQLQTRHAMTARPAGARSTRGRKRRWRACNTRRKWSRQREPLTIRSRLQNGTSDVELGGLDGGTGFLIMVQGKRHALHRASKAATRLSWKHPRAGSKRDAASGSQERWQARQPRGSLMERDQHSPRVTGYDDGLQ